MFKFNKRVDEEEELEEGEISDDEPESLTTPPTKEKLTKTKPKTIPLVDEESESEKDYVIEKVKIRPSSPLSKKDRKEQKADEKAGRYERRSMTSHSPENLPQPQPIPMQNAERYFAYPYGFPQQGQQKPPIRYMPMGYNMGQNIGQGMPQGQPMGQPMGQNISMQYPQSYPQRPPQAQWQEASPVKMHIGNQMPDFVQQPVYQYNPQMPYQYQNYPQNGKFPINPLPQSNQALQSHQFHQSHQNIQNHQIHETHQIPHQQLKYPSNQAGSVNQPVFYQNQNSGYQSRIQIHNNIHQPNNQIPNYGQGNIQQDGYSKLAYDKKRKQEEEDRQRERERELIREKEREKDREREREREKERKTQQIRKKIKETILDLPSENERSSMISLLSKVRNLLSYKNLEKESSEFYENINEIHEMIEENKARQKAYEILEILEYEAIISKLKEKELEARIIDEKKRKEVEEMLCKMQRRDPRVRAS